VQRETVSPGASCLDSRSKDWKKKKVVRYRDRSNERGFKKMRTKMGWTREEGIDGV